jgi:hypothetical protein
VLKSLIIDFMFAVSSGPAPAWLDQNSISTGPSLFWSSTDEQAVSAVRDMAPASTVAITRLLTRHLLG